MEFCDCPYRGFVILGDRLHYACGCEKNFQSPEGPFTRCPVGWRKFPDPYFGFYKRLDALMKEEDAPQ